MNRRALINVMGVLFLTGFISQAGAETGNSKKGFTTSSPQRFSEETLEVRNNKQGVPVGRFRAIFDGADLKRRAVWLNDFRYELYPGYKAVDGRSKPISLSSIPLGEYVYVVIEKNANKPTTPYLVRLKYAK